jgi:aubergine-like protein
MVCGYDTYHDSAQRGRSAGGFVASINDFATRYFSQVSFHDSREEMSSKFAEHIAVALNEYYDINKCFPAKLLIYRDGVGEGSIRLVHEFEVDQVRKAIKQVARDVPIRLTFIIVSKRVNARFFGRRGGRFDNPPPGTIVDQGVTRKERYDFFLISQTVREGTITPTMFDIILDEIGWRPTHHQCLAYKLTHLYYNWQVGLSMFFLTVQNLNSISFSGNRESAGPLPIRSQAGVSRWTIAS